MTAIYDNMSISVDVANNGLIITRSVTSSAGFYNQADEKKFVATSNTEALTFITELACSGVALLGHDVPTDSTPDLDQIKSKIRAWWEDHVPCTGLNDLDDLFATL